MSFSRCSWILIGKRLGNILCLFCHLAAQSHLNVLRVLRHQVLSEEESSPGPIQCPSCPSHPEIFHQKLTCWVLLLNTSHIWLFNVFCFCEKRDLLILNVLELIRALPDCEGSVGTSVYTCGHHSVNVALCLCYLTRSMSFCAFTL